MLDRSHRAPLLAALAAFAAYAATLAPGVTFEDSGELIAAAWVTGIPHEPGYPLYTMLAHLFAQLPFGSVAWRVNLFSALAASAGVFFFTRAAQRALPAAFALCAGLLAAFSREGWSQSLIAEVYGLNLLLFGLALDLLARWSLEPEAQRRRSLLTGLALVLGLAASHHGSAALWSPALALVVLVQRPRDVLDARLVAQCVGAFALGLAPLLYLPWASLRDPALDWGNPETWQDFVRVVTRHQYGVEPVHSLSEAGVQFALLARLTAQQWPAVLLLLVPPGLWWLAREPKRLLAPVVLLWLACGPVVALLTNFPVGTDNPVVNAENSGLASVFFIPAHWMLALAAAGGLALAAQRLSAVPARAVAALALLLPLGVAAWQWGRVDMSRQVYAQRYLDGLFALAQPGALVLNTWDPYHFPTLYAQHVEGRRPDVVVLDQFMLSTSWYVRQQRSRQGATFAPVQAQADAFLAAAAPFEAGQPSDRDFVYSQYRALVEALIAAAVASGRDVLLTFEPSAETRARYAVEPLYWGYRLRAAPAVTAVDPAALGIADFLSPDVANDRMATHVRDQLESVVAARLRWCATQRCPDRTALEPLRARLAAARQALSARAR